jgi:Ser/Thr protein kinase RdoA (MazF antagonist)
MNDPHDPHDPRPAAAAFRPDGLTCPIMPLGHGNINETFLVTSTAGPFVLQRINRHVFPEPLRVIDNFAKVTRHLVRKRSEGEGRFRTAQPVRTLAGTLSYLDHQGDYWRGQTYLADTGCKTLTGALQAEQVGRTLATFHRLVADLDVRCLAEPLPGFHNLTLYLREWERLRPIVRSETNGMVNSCLAAIAKGRERAVILEGAKNAGILTIQPIHGDPKLDNFLFGDDDEVVGMIDLDTVGAGIVHYDLGDCLRSCCNRAGENGAGGAAVFDMAICRALLEGYFSQPQPLLTARQRIYIFDAVMAITFELGVRFFTDHLRGNTYFKVQKEGDNLLRAVRQFHLVEDIVRQEAAIRSLAVTSGCP